MKKIVNLLCYFIIILSTIIFVYKGICYGAGEGQVGIDMRGINYLKAFTIDSNILGGIVSLLSVIFLFKKSKKNALPRWLVTLQLIASSVLSLTFLVVVFYLGVKNVLNGKSYIILFMDDMFYFHLVNPVLMVILFLSNRKYKLNNKDILLSFIPLVVYGILYFLGAVVFKNWNDIYGFLFNGKYYLTIIAVLVISILYFGINKVLIKLYNKK